jgi:hypothetical protein
MGLLPGKALQEFYWALGEFMTRLVYASLPIEFAVCAWFWLRAFREAQPSKASEADAFLLARARFFTTAGVSLGITSSAFPRADYVHIATIYPAVALILFALGRAGRLGRGWTDPVHETQAPPSRRFRIEAALVALLLSTTVFLVVRYDAILTHRLTLDRADLRVRAEDAWQKSLITYLRRQVAPGEPLFIYGRSAVVFPC